MINEYNLKEGNLTIQVPKELDHHQANRLRSEADLLIETYSIKRLIFDFSGTEFMDSSGIGVIIGRCRKMNFYGGEVLAKNMNSRVEKIFTVSGLKKLIKVEGDYYDKTK